MKIRNQFILLLMSLATTPLLYLVGHAVYLRLYTPEHLLYDQENGIRIVKNLDLSPEDEKLLVGTIYNRDKDMEDAFLLGDGTILMSNIPEFAGKKRLEFEELFQILEEFHHGALYQITMYPAHSMDIPLFRIVKVREKDFDKLRRTTNLSSHTMHSVLFIALIAEIICLVFVSVILYSVSKSITFVERNTELLADGSLETPIARPNTIFLANEISMLSNNLEILRRTLKAQKDQRDRFIMGMSHDLKTPIAIIKGYTEAMADGLIDKGKMDESLEIINSKATQLERMIEVLINFIKIDSTSWRENLAEHNLSEFLTNYAEQSKITGEVFKRNIITSINMPPVLMVRMDENLVDRALSNIFSNAIRYSSEGDTIVISASANDEAARISIMDTGVGMESEDASKIFDLFYRATSSRREEGMGIGLTVVKSIIETHGWTLSVVSEPDKGSEFIINIPLK